MNLHLPLPLLLLCALSCCETVDEPPQGCFDSTCETYSYSFVDANTNENLMGTDGQPFHPDSIAIFTDKWEEIRVIPGYQESIDWWTVRFSYYDALRRCDLHETDSTFDLKFYFYLNKDDFDTLTITFAPCLDFAAIFYNEYDLTPVENEPVKNSSFYCPKNLNP